MKSWFLAPLLSATLLVGARADDLNARATQIKSQLQTSWLPAWAAKSPANESATDAAYLLETLSHAHRLGYSTPQLNLLDAARVHYRLLRDSRRDKTNDGFFNPEERTRPVKYTLIQSQVMSALVEYARASGEGEPRGLAIKTWRLVRDRARDKINGGYFDSFLSATPGPTEASASGAKSGIPHLALLEAGTVLFGLTRDRSIKTNVVELLDLSEGRFFPARVEETVWQFSADWKILMRPTDLIGPAAFSAFAKDGYYRSTSNYAGSTIARAQNALGTPVEWVDFSRRANDIHEVSNPLYIGNVLESSSLLARNIPASRERRAAQIDEVLGTLNGQTPDIRSGAALLDFVAAFSNAIGE